MDPKHSIDEHARQQYLLELGAKLDKIDEDMRNGKAKFIPAEEVVERLKAIVDANRRKIQNG